MLKFPLFVIAAFALALPLCAALAEYDALDEQSVPKTLSGKNVAFWSERIPEGSESHVRLRLKLTTDPRLAELRIALGRRFICLCTREGKLQLSHSLSWWDLRRKIDAKPAPKAVLDGQPFEFHVDRKDGRLTISLAGQRLLSVKDLQPSLGAVGVCLAGTGSVQIAEFKLESQFYGSYAAQQKAAAELRDFARNFPVVDLSKDRSHDVVLAKGSQDLYQGHPTAVQLPDGRLIAVWTVGHGGTAGPAAESCDGGKTWKRIDERFPAGYRRHVNCPSIYRLVGPDGKARLWVWSEAKQRPQDKPTDYHTCRYDFETAMPSVVSEDEGYTWREMPPLGSDFRCVMTFASIVQLKDGSYLGLFHRGPGNRDRSPLTVWASVTRDGGFTWSTPRLVAQKPYKDLCEPYVFRSPDGTELCCILRENLGTGNAMVMWSKDEGRTWSDPVDTPWALTGHRHQGVTLPDGRLLIAFRDKALCSPTLGHFVAWVGPYEAIRSGKPEGTQRLKLLHSFNGGDCGYPGVTLLPNGKVMAVTYIRYEDDDSKPSVVAKVFSVPAE